jgi:hypothetical protein
MKNLKVFSTFTLLSAVLLLMLSCDDGSDKLTGSVPSGSLTDVSASSDLTFVQDLTGAGATLDFTGSDLDEIILVVADGEVVADDLAVTDEGGSIQVPLSLDLGMTEFQFLFIGSRSVKRQIELVPLPNIQYYTPRSVSEGEQVTLEGVNFNKVSEASIGGLSVTIDSQDDNEIVFTVPVGAESDFVALFSEELGSTSFSPDSLIACDVDSDHLLCLPVINTNGSFEEGELGESATVPGWGLGSEFATYEITDEEKYDGFKSAKITVTGISPDAWRIQPNTNMPVDPTKTYHLSFWVKGTGFSNIKFAIDGGGTPDYTEYGNPEVSVTSGEWTEISYDFTPSAEADGGDNIARFAPSMSYEGNLGGVIYFDNLRVTEVTQEVE